MTNRIAMVVSISYSVKNPPQSIRICNIKTEQALFRLVLLAIFIGSTHMSIDRVEYVIALVIITEISRFKQPLKP